MDRYAKDELTAKNLVCKKFFPFPRKIGKPVAGGGGGMAIGGLRVKEKQQQKIEQLRSKNK